MFRNILEYDSTLQKVRECSGIECYRKFQKLIGLYKAIDFGTHHQLIWDFIWITSEEKRKNYRYNSG